MALYKVFFPTNAAQKSFDKNLAKVPRLIRERVLDVLESLSANPKPIDSGSFKRLNPPVEVFSLTAQYRLRVGDYRILYDVDDQTKTVWILTLRKRSESTYSR